MREVNININNNQITNIHDVLRNINSQELDFNMTEYLKTLKNRLSNEEIQNKKEVLDAINTKLLEYEIMNQEVTDNLTSLRMLQQTNEEFEKLSIIQTNSEKNDSGKYIDYITYKRDDGQLEVLCCAGENSINDFIQTHKDTIQSYTAADVFRLYKEYYHESLDFMNEQEYQKDKNINENKPREDDRTISLEREILEDYKNKYTVQGEIKMSVDQFGERLYQIGDGLFKFHTVAGERKLETLKPPTLEEQKSNNYDLLDELDKSDDLNVSVQKQEVEETKTYEEVDTYQSLPFIDESDFVYNKLIEITQEKKLHENEPNYYTNEEDEHLLNIYTKYLIEKMKVSIQMNNPNPEEYELLIYLLETPTSTRPSIMDLYSDEPDKLTGLEKEFAMHYEEVLLKRQELINSQNYEKSKSLILEDKHEQGVATIIMLMEIILLALCVLTFIKLDIL